MTDANEVGREALLQWAAQRAVVQQDLERLDARLTEAEGQLSSVRRMLESERREIWLHLGDLNRRVRRAVHVEVFACLWLLVGVALSVLWWAA